MAHLRLVYEYSDAFIHIIHTTVYLC